MVERTTKRTTRSTNSAAVPTGRDGSRWIPKEWTVAEFAPVHKLTAFWALKEVFFFAIAEVIKVSRTHFLRASIGHHARIICHPAIKNDLAALVSQLALKLVERRENEACKLGVLSKEQTRNRHHFAAGSGADTSNYQ